MHKTTVFLIRHGQTDHNATGRWQGWLPTSLNETGRQEARELAKYLKNRFSGEIFSSDLPRAYETAEIIGDHLGLENTKDERFREINVGVFQGLTRDEIQTRYDGQYARWREDDTFAPHQGESYDQMRQRAYLAMMDRLQATTNDQLMIVTHGGVIRALIRYLFPESESQFIPNTSITITDYFEGVWSLKEFAATPHLNPA